MPQLNSKAGILDAMDEYAIKILEWLYEHSVKFISTEPFNAKIFLEVIKTELK